jgi:hypothetical protein
MLVLGILIGIAASLVVNYFFPAFFAKLTRKAGQQIEKL